MGGQRSARRSVMIMFCCREFVFHNVYAASSRVPPWVDNHETTFRLSTIGPVALGIRFFVVFARGVHAEAQRPRICTMPFPKKGVAGLLFPRHVGRALVFTRENRFLSQLLPRFLAR